MMGTLSTHVPSQGSGALLGSLLSGSAQGSVGAGASQSAELTKVMGALFSNQNLSPAEQRRYDEAVRVYDVVVRERDQAVLARKSLAKQLSDTERLLTDANQENTRVHRTLKSLEATEEARRREAQIAGQIAGEAAGRRLGDMRTHLVGEPVGDNPAKYNRSSMLCTSSSQNTACPTLPRAS